MDAVIKKETEDKRRYTKILRRAYAQNFGLRAVINSFAVFVAAQAANAHGQAIVAVDADSFLDDENFFAFLETMSIHILSCGGNVSVELFSTHERFQKVSLYYEGAERPPYSAAHTNYEFLELREMQMALMARKREVGDKAIIFIITNEEQASTCTDASIVPIVFKQEELTQDALQEQVGAFLLQEPIKALQLSWMAKIRHNMLQQIFFHIQDLQTQCDPSNVVSIANLARAQDDFLKLCGVSRVIREGERAALDDEYFKRNNDMLATCMSQSNEMMMGLVRHERDLTRQIRLYSWTPEIPENMRDKFLAHPPFRPIVEGAYVIEDDKLKSIQEAIGKRYGFESCPPGSPVEARGAVLGAAAAKHR